MSANGFGGRRRFVGVLGLIIGLVAALLVSQTVQAAANPSIPGGSSGPGGSIWVPNYGSGSILEINPDTMRKKRETKFTGDHPMVIKMSPDKKKLFIGNFGPFDWSVTVLDTRTGKVIKKIPTILPAYAVIQMSRNGRRLYVPTAASVTQVIDTTTLQTIRTIPLVLPPGIAHIEVSDDEKYVYGFASTGTITKYDAYTGAPVAVPLQGAGLVPGWGATSADGNTMYAINFFNSVTVIDVKNWRVVRNISVEPFGSGPISATLTPDGTELWVCNYTTDDVQIFDAKSGVLKRTMRTDGAAVYIGFTDDGKTGYLSVVDDGGPLPYFSPFVKDWQYYMKHEAWFASLMRLNTRVEKIDTRTLRKTAQFQQKGAFVAGVYPA